MESTNAGAREDQKNLKLTFLSSYTKTPSVSIPNCFLFQVEHNFFCSCSAGSAKSAESTIGTYHPVTRYYEWSRVFGQNIACGACPFDAACNFSKPAVS